MITIYTQPGCGRCHVLKQKLGMKGIEYTESQDVNKMQELGLTALPVMEVDGEILTFEKAIKFVNER